MNVVGGRRQSAADAYLRPHLGRPQPWWSSPTLKVQQRLRFDGRRCRGADYTTAEGDHRVDVEREVVVCAGAVGSARLAVMLSGIGPAQHLRDNGVDVILDAPGRGPRPPGPPPVLAALRRRAPPAADDSRAPA